MTQELEIYRVIQLRECRDDDRHEWKYYDTLLTTFDFEEAYDYVEKNGKKQAQYHKIEVQKAEIRITDWK